RLIDSTIVRISRTIKGARPNDGSSRTRIAGPDTRARPIGRIRRSPPLCGARPARPGTRAAAERAHLLPAAAEGAGELVTPLGEPREPPQHLLERLLDGLAVATPVRAPPEILEDPHLREEAGG